MKAQAKAQLKSLRVAPRKVRLMLDLIRGLPVDRAIEQLEFSKQHAARPIRKLLNSAIANAITNHSLKRETLQVTTVFVDEGRTLKRWMPRAMGRATPIRKRTAHITVILTGEVGETATVHKTASADQEKSAASAPATETAAKEEKGTDKKEAKQTTRAKQTTATAPAATKKTK